ncbi:MAG: serine hydrolase domain-containing protein [Pyrinomonadaceae bacterium]
MKQRVFYSIAFAFLISAFVFPIGAQELSREKIKEIERMISSKMSKDRIPGASVAIVLNGKLVWSNGYGLADIENFVPAKADTAYRTASIGKSMTATAAMQLVEKGKLDLTAPIQNYCPAFPKKRWTITAQNLLNHTSGIRHYGEENNIEELYSTRHYNSVAEALEIFKNDELLFEPGGRYLYSTYGYNLLGCVIEGASGLAFTEYMAKNIFEPAGMKNTRVDDPSAIIPNRARGYVLDQAGHLQNSRMVDMSNKIPAGGFITTAEDLVLFASGVMNGKLIKPETLDRMLTPQKTNSGETIPYGLGWGLFPDEDWYGEKEAFHGGGTPQVSGMLYLIPKRKFAVAILFNLEDVSERVALTAQIAKVALDLGKNK